MKNTITLLTFAAAFAAFADEPPKPQIGPRIQPAIGAPVQAPAKKIHRAPNGKAFPAHWGAPPLRQTRDLRPLPGGYGRGSGTLARWIASQLALDKKNPNRAKLKPPIAAPAPPPDSVAPAPNAPEVNPADIAKVKAALAAWAKAKTKCGGNYEYTIGFQSAFGFGHTTTIVVKNNKVFERRFEEFNRREPPRPGAKPKGFTEQGDAIGKNKKGAPAKTLDEIYKTAAAIAAKALPPHEIRYVRTDKNGLLTSCFIRDRRIADDAPRKGVAIGRIKLGVAKDAAIAAPDCLYCRTEAHQLHLGLADDGGTITVKLGSVVRVKLRGNPTTGFTWNNATPAGTLKLMGKVTHQAGGRPGLVGAPGMSIATFATTALGKGTIVLHYNRVFEKNKPAAQTVRINIVVTKDGRVQPPAAPGNNSARIAALEQEIAKMKDYARRARFTPEGFKKFQAKLAKLEQELAALKAGGAKPKAKGPKLPAKLTLRDAQGGFAGFTGWVFTINEDGSWNRRQFFNRQLRPIAQQGQLPPARIEAIAKLMAGAAKLPAKLGKPVGANPHVFTLTIGEKQCVLTMPPGAKLPAAGKLDDLGRFAMIANELAGLRKLEGNVKKVFKAPNGQPFPERWGATPRIQVRDLRVLPNGYGRGSSTLAKWIQDNLDKDKKAGIAPPKPGPPIVVRPPIRPLPIRPPGGRKPFPAHWGAPPRIQTSDIRPLPGGYGQGSSTLAGWIQQNLNKDAAGRKPGAANPNQAQIARLKNRLKQIKNFMTRAPLTKPTLDRYNAEVKKLEEMIQKLKVTVPDPKPGVQPVPKPGIRPLPRPGIRPLPRPIPPRRILPVKPEDR